MTDSSLLNFGFPDPPIEPHVKGRPPVPVGTRKVTEYGYVLVKVDVREWKYEHRIVMEKAIGRSLHSLEKVFHRNSDLSDNRLENLILGIVTAPKGERLNHCPTCTCIRLS